MKINKKKHRVTAPGASGGFKSNIRGRKQLRMQRRLKKKQNRNSWYNRGKAATGDKQASTSIKNAKIKQLQAMVEAEKVKMKKGKTARSDDNEDNGVEDGEEEVDGFCPSAAAKSERMARLQEFVNQEAGISTSGTKKTPEEPKTSQDNANLIKDTKKLKDLRNEQEKDTKEINKLARLLQINKTQRKKVAPMFADEFGSLLQDIECGSMSHSQDYKAEGVDGDADFERDMATALGKNVKKGKGVNGRSEEEDVDEEEESDEEGDIEEEEESDEDDVEDSDDSEVTQKKKKGKVKEKTKKMIDKEKEKNEQKKKKMLEEIEARKVKPQDDDRQKKTKKTQDIKKTKSSKIKQGCDGGGSGDPENRFTARDFNPYGEFSDDDAYYDDDDAYYDDMYGDDDEMEYDTGRKKVRFSNLPLKDDGDDDDGKDEDGDDEEEEEDDDAKFSDESEEDVKKKGKILDKAELEEDEEDGSYLDSEEDSDDDRKLHNPYDEEEEEDGGFIDSQAEEDSEVDEESDDDRELIHDPRNEIDYAFQGGSSYCKPEILKNGMENDIDRYSSNSDDDVDLEEFVVEDDDVEYEDVSDELPDELSDSPSPPKMRKKRRIVVQSDDDSDNGEDSDGIADFYYYGRVKGKEVKGSMDKEGEAKGKAKIKMTREKMEDLPDSDSDSLQSSPEKMTEDEDGDDESDSSDVIPRVKTKKKIEEEEEEDGEEVTELKVKKKILDDDDEEEEEDEGKEKISKLKTKKKIVDDDDEEEGEEEEDEGKKRISKRKAKKKIVDDDDDEEEEEEDEDKKRISKRKGKKKIEDDEDEDDDEENEGKEEVKELKLKKKKEDNDKEEKDKEVKELKTKKKMEDNDKENDATRDSEEDATQTKTKKKKKIESEDDNDAVIEDSEEPKMKKDEKTKEDGENILNTKTKKKKKKKAESEDEDEGVTSTTDLEAQKEKEDDGKEERKDTLKKKTKKKKMEKSGSDDDGGVKLNDDVRRVIGKGKELRVVIIRLDLDNDSEDTPTTVTKKKGKDSDGEMKMDKCEKVKKKKIDEDREMIDTEDDVSVKSSDMLSMDSEDDATVTAKLKALETKMKMGMDDDRDSSTISSTEAPQTGTKKKKAAKDNTKITTENEDKTPNIKKKKKGKSNEINIKYKMEIDDSENTSTMDSLDGKGFSKTDENDADVSTADNDAVTHNKLKKKRKRKALKDDREESSTLDSEDVEITSQIKRKKREDDDAQIKIVKDNDSEGSKDNDGDGSKRNTVSDDDAEIEQIKKKKRKIDDDNDDKATQKKKPKQTETKLEKTTKGKMEKEAKTKKMETNKKLVPLPDISSEEDEEGGEEEEEEEEEEMEDIEEEEEEEETEIDSEEELEEEELEESEEGDMEEDEDSETQKIENKTPENTNTEQKPEELTEDIYGRLRDKDGNIVTEKDKEDPGSSRYIPPALRKLSALNRSKEKKEQLEALKRNMKGLLNRLAESNMGGIAGEIEGMYSKHARNDVSEIMTSLLMEALVGPTLTPERLMQELAVLVALLSANVGNEVGAHILNEFVMKWSDKMAALSPDAEGGTKELDNLVLFISYLYCFKVVEAGLIYDILHRLAQGFSAKEVELILLVLRSVGFNLRKDDPLALKGLITKLQEKAAKAHTTTTTATTTTTTTPGPSGSKGEGEGTEYSRVTFMLETIQAVRNNNMSKLPNYDPEHTDHLRQLLRGLVRRGQQPAHLNVTLEDMLRARECGRWWVVGSAWSGGLVGERGQTDMRAKNKTAMDVSFSDAFMRKATKLQLQRPPRVNILYVVTEGSEDYLDAFEKLLQLSLPPQQEREMFSVILLCCQKGKVYNPFFSHLSDHMCKFDKKYSRLLQFALWDKFEEVEAMKVREVNNLAKFLTHLIGEGSLNLTIFKNVAFMDADKQTISMVRQTLLALLLHPTGKDAVERIFSVLSASPKLKMLRHSLRIFILKFIKGKKSSEDTNIAMLSRRVQAAVEILNSGGGVRL